jgi:uncharacterized coiled-coil DUF342 family protein
METERSSGWEISEQILGMEQERDLMVREVAKLEQDKNEAEENLADLTDQVEELLEQVATLRPGSRSDFTNVRKSLTLSIL